MYTDGACLGNPGPGGWAAIIRSPDGREQTLSGSATLTTNNRMEIRAALEALRRLPRGKDVHVLLRTDSRYLADAIGKGWAARWRQKGWRLSSGDRTENIDLWEPLLEELDQRTVRVEWTKAHDGDPLNERCDSLARSEAEHATGVDEGYTAERTEKSTHRKSARTAPRTKAVQCTRMLDGRIAISDGTATVVVAVEDVPPLVSELVSLVQQR